MNAPLPIPTKASSIPADLFQSTVERAEALKREQQSEHARRVRQYNEEARRFPHALFFVVEVTTGNRITDAALPIRYAQSVCHYHDYAGLGTHEIQPANEQGKQLLEARAAVSKAGQPF